ncbi:MAG: ABC transporter ATP-binding protein [Oscillospiraceae bacterium]
MSDELLTLQNLSKYYASAQQVTVGLNSINLSFCRGEFVAVTGESGSGKSTLAHVLGGILPYEGGELLFEGRPTSHYDSADWERYRRDCVSFISQSYGILPGATVMDNAVSALRLTGLSGAEAKGAAEDILREVELWELRGRRAAKLSSGQKQRLSIARALAKPAPILIADEPTGNLDAENSAKVISLLAKAAEERLVILITHEFSEAEDSVTRHICLHDGRVTMDSRLREPAPAPGPKAAQRGRRKGLGLYVAGLQLRSRPVWSVLMLLFFTLTVFAVFAFAGTFISSLDDTPTRLYDDSAFQNGNNRRIVVCKPDGSDMTGEDEEILLGVKYVEALERYSYLADIKYAYREDVDYRWRYTMSTVGGGPDAAYQKVSSVTFTASEMPFAATVPRFADGRSLLTGGRLPENMYEVVASGDESLIGESFPVYLQDRKNWSQSYYIYLEVTVVGVTDYGSGLYFHDDLGKVFLSDVQLFADIPDTGWYFIYMPALDLEGSEARFEKGIYERTRSSRGEDSFSFKMPRLDCLNDVDSALALDFSSYHLSSFPSVIEVSQETFDTLTHAGNGGQISLTIEDYAYTDRVLSQLYKLGYAAVSPYRECSTVQDPELAEQRMQTLRICALALAAALALQVVVQRAMFSLETESYLLMKNIGLDCRTAMFSVFWQVLAFALCGQALGLSAILELGAVGIESIGRLLRYLPASYRVLLSLLHLGACALTAAWIMNALRKQAYPSSDSVPDLDWNTLDEEAKA